MAHGDHQRVCAAAQTPLTCGEKMHAGPKCQRENRITLNEGKGGSLYFYPRGGKNKNVSNNLIALEVYVLTKTLTTSQKGDVLPFV